MNELGIQLHCASTKEACGLCGQRNAFGAGPHLVLVKRSELVCRDCGRRHSPALSALVDLARAADRVGRIGRHIVCPPMTALLDLSRAAENFAQTTQKSKPSEKLLR